MNRIGVQLYTVRGLLTSEQQIRDTLLKIKEIGYDSVQLYDSLHHAKICAYYAKQAGLAVTSAHSSLEMIREDFDQYMDLCQCYGIEELGISNMKGDPEMIPGFVDGVNSLAAALRDKGLILSYHNHAVEFLKMPSGKTIMQHYFEGFDPETVYFMPDTFWLHYGGADVRHFLELTKGRVNTIHLKDWIFTRKGADFAAVGQGNLYFEGILEQAMDLNIRNYVVEQDVCPGDPLESLRQSYNYIRHLIRN